MKNFTQTIHPFWISIAAVALFALRTTPALASVTDTAAGTLKTLSLPTTLVRPWAGKSPRRQVVVYTPSGYDAPQNAGRRYPVLYLLHGSPGNPFNFVKYGKWPAQMESVVKQGEVSAAILVMPDGNYAGQKEGDSEWADSADRRDRFESWICQEIVPYIDSHYRTKAEASARILAGVSEGGFGSVNLALRNPRLFGGAIGLSGYYDMRGFGWGHIIMNDSDAAMSLNSPLYYVPEKTQSGHVPPEWRSLRIFVGAGEEEKPYAQETRSIAAALQKAGISQVQLSTPNGKHDWNLWTSLFLAGLKFTLPASRS
jgi:enterochelin esterase-like enzyme